MSDNEVVSENWVFLGDSLTEGVGSSRISYVTELVKLLRVEKSTPVDEVRLRWVNPDEFNRFLRVNLAGYVDHDRKEDGARIWLWNLASEGTTVDTDLQWLHLIENLRPTRVFVLRGALESILRPAEVLENNWPFWVPHSWRGYAAMDPRCYFSTTPWRRAKQIFMDRLKQKVRLALLEEISGKPLIPPDKFFEHFERLVISLKRLTESVHILGLPLVNLETFPGSRKAFCLINEELQNSALALGVDFLGWSDKIEQLAQTENLFYLDGFHPNQAGARLIGRLLYEHLTYKVISL